MNTKVTHHEESVLEVEYPSQQWSSTPRSAKAGGGYIASPFTSPAEFGSRIYRSTFSHSFPYAHLHLTKGGLVQVKRTLVILENERFKVSVSPDKAGKLVGIYDKQLDRELIWQSPNSYYANIGLNGKWTVGGVEWNAGRFGHTVHSVYNVGYDLVTFANGRTGIAFGATDELLQTSWHVTLALGETQVLARIRLENHSNRPQPKYWWTNIAAPITERTRLLYQPGPLLLHTVNYGNCYVEETWPVVRGRDASDWYQQVENISAYLHKNTGSVIGYSECRDGWSFFHRANPKICKGRKLWSLGSDHAHAIWWDRVAEVSWLPYVEMQSGLSPMQVELQEFGPGEVIEWTESFGTVPEAFPDSAPASYAGFETAVHNRTGAEWDAAQDAAFWTVSKKETGLEPELRLRVSQEIVAKGHVTTADLNETIQNEWVGGPDWINFLGKLDADTGLDARQRLVFAGALTDANRLGEASRELAAIPADAHATIRAKAAFLKGMIAAEEDRDEEAIGEYLASIALDPRQPQPYSQLNRLYKKHNRTGERLKLWTSAHPEIQENDDCRVQLAEIALQKGHFPEVRNWLRQPLYQTMECGYHACRLFKESFVAEALLAETQADYSSALQLLSRAAMTYPQFNIGRDEVWLNTDLLYYRWRIAKAANHPVVAAGFLAHGLGQYHRPYTTEAAYQYRLAHEAGHNSAQRRSQELLAYDAAEGNERINAVVPVRGAVLRAVHDKKWDLWEALREDDVYRFRAEWEIRKRAL